MECKILLIRSNDQTLPSWTSFTMVLHQTFSLSKYSILTIQGSNNLGTNMCVVCESNNTRVKLTGDPDHPTTPSPSLKKTSRYHQLVPRKKDILYIYGHIEYVNQKEALSVTMYSLSLFSNFIFAFFLSKYWKERG